MPKKVVPWAEQEHTETKKERSQKQEKRVARQLAGRVQPMSGAGDYRKGDVECKHLLIEAKTTTRSSYSIKRSILELICQHAYASSKIPAVAITFEEMAKHERDWILVPLSFLKDFLDNE